MAELVIGYLLFRLAEHFLVKLFYFFTNER